MRGYLQLRVYNRISDQSIFVSCLLAMSNARDATRALNTLFREGHDIFGGCDGSALLDFVHKFFYGDNPVDSDGKWNVINLAILYRIIITEDEVQEQISNFNGKIHTHN